MRTQSWSRVMAAVVLMTGYAFGQTAADPGEGLRADAGASAGSVSIRWWGKAGRTYFIQTSTTLYPWDWTYLPAIEAGADAVLSIGIPVQQERLFVRLIGTDMTYTTGSPGTADFDGDGLTNAGEVAQELGTDPFKTDTDFDGYSDSEEVAAGSNASNPNSNSGEKGLETGGVEKPVYLFGFHKVVGKSWYEAPQTQSSVYWYDSTPYSSNTTYTGFNSQVDQRMGTLSYPQPGEWLKLTNLGHQTTGAAWQVIGNGVGNATLL